MGHEQPIPAVTVGHEQPIPAVTVGHEQPIPAVTVGHEQTIPAVTVGHEQPIPAVTVGHEQPIPAVTGWGMTNPYQLWQWVGIIHVNWNDQTQNVENVKMKLPNRTHYSSYNWSAVTESSNRQCLWMVRGIDTGFVNTLNAMNWSYN